MKIIPNSGTYLIKANNRWYMCVQVSQKRWEATVFSHVDAPSLVRHFFGNTKTLVEQLKELNGAELDEWIICTTNPQLRRVMFEILKTGRYTGEEEL